MKPTKEQITKELTRRASKPFRVEDYLFPQQLTFVLDPARFKIAVTTRRAGKTVSCAADLIHTAMYTAGAISVYITLSRANAKRIVWPELKRIIRKFRIAAKFNESELSVQFVNGSTIYCSGASDRTEIEKFRGLALTKVYIDESQSFPAYIEELINDVLAPALLDHAGTLCLIGTPGPVPSGYFHSCATNEYWNHHHWTFWDNPFILNHKEVFDAELKRRGIDASHPSIQREWFGKWSLDTDSLVFKYNKEKNDYGELPSSNFTYILGVDLGYDDADAICVLAWSDHDKCTYLVEEKITRKQGITELVEQIEQLRKRYGASKVVLDQGGLGKKIAEELSRRYQIPVQAAEKTRKNEYIELMNDALRTGVLKAKSTSQFAQDCMMLEWDHNKSTPDKLVVSDRFHSDICDAVLYAWRESYAFSYVPPKPPAKEGSREWLEALEAKALEHFTALEEANKDPFGSGGFGY